eukprot:m.812556 g.812556  ORF g.812556 m.812556 type:complete len:1399 (+) comp59344_c0_seq2:163-4359(+)
MSVVTEKDAVNEQKRLFMRSLSEKSSPVGSPASARKHRPRGESPACSPTRHSRSPTPRSTPRGTPVPTQDSPLSKPAQSQATIERKAKITFNNLIVEAKECESRSDLKHAITLYQQANDLIPNEKIVRKLRRLNASYQQELDAEEETRPATQFEVDRSAGVCRLDDTFYLSTSTYDALFPHQREGVAWLWSIHNLPQHGGILGDDMGLGKTVQIVTFLSALFESDLIQTAMVVLPVSLLPNWLQEFNKWAPHVTVKTFHGTKKKERAANLSEVQAQGGVLLTTYGMLASNLDDLTKRGTSFKWDYLILDEGHKIKNSSSQVSKSAESIPSVHRIAMTGTPIQNSLSEMWALFDFVCQGQLLGSKETFGKLFEAAIIRATDRDATESDRQLGEDRAQALRQIIEPFFLRRDKETIFPQGKTTATAANLTEASQDFKGLTLQKKRDFIVWTKLAPTQERIYRHFLDSERVQELLNTTRSPLAALTVLKKICDHPDLLANYTSYQAELLLEERKTGDADEEAQAADIQALLPLLQEAKGAAKGDLVASSGKLQLLASLLQNLFESGHRCLVFSQSRMMLDMIERTSGQYSLLRIDGTVSDPAERQKRVDKFNRDRSIFCLLLTTQVGGVGLNLTGADRVVIFDPSWNPATDAQAVDRAYRLGQKKDVVIYRLVTCGTVEEKIYRRQIFKNTLSKAATQSSKPLAYFTRQELRALFVLDDVSVSETQNQLAQSHGPVALERDEQEQVSFLKLLPTFVDVSDHMAVLSSEAKSHHSVSAELQAKTQSAVAQLQSENVSRVDDLRENPPPTPRKKSAAKTPGTATKAPVDTHRVPVEAISESTTEVAAAPVDHDDLDNLRRLAEDWDNDEAGVAVAHPEVRKSDGIDLDNTRRLAEDWDNDDLTDLAAHPHSVVAIAPASQAEEDDDLDNVRRMAEDWDNDDILTSAYAPSESMVVERQDIIAPQYDPEDELDNTRRCAEDWDNDEILENAFVSETTTDTDHIIPPQYDPEDELDNCRRMAEDWDNDEGALTQPTHLQSALPEEDIQLYADAPLRMMRHNAATSSGYNVADDGSSNETTEDEALHADPVLVLSRHPATKGSVDSPAADSPADADEEMDSSFAPGALLLKRCPALPDSCDELSEEDASSQKSQAKAQALAAADMAVDTPSASASSDGEPASEPLPEPTLVLTSSSPAPIVDESDESFAASTTATTQEEPTEQTFERPLRVGRVSYASPMSYLMSPTSSSVNLLARTSRPSLAGSKSAVNLLSRSSRLNVFDSPANHQSSEPRVRKASHDLLLPTSAEAEAAPPVAPVCHKTHSEVVKVHHCRCFGTVDETSFQAHLTAMKYELVVCAYCGMKAPCSSISRLAGRRKRKARLLRRGHRLWQRWTFATRTNGFIFIL